MIFNTKIMLTPKQPANKCSFDYLHWLLNYGKLYRKDGVLHAVHTSGASPQSSTSHLLTFLVAQLQFFRDWNLSDRRLYEGFERRLLIWGNPKERNSPDYYPFQKHTFFLRHPVLLKLFPAYLKIIFLNIKVPYMHSVTTITRNETPPTKSGLWYCLLCRHYKLFRIEARTKSHNDCLQILTCGSVDDSLYSFLVDHGVKGSARTLPLSPSLFLHLTWTPIFRVSTNGPVGNYSITFLTQPTGR